MTDLSTRAEDGEGTLNSLSLFGGRGAAKVIEADLEPLVRFGVELVVWVRERVGQLVPSCATGIKGTDTCRRVPVPRLPPSRP